MRDSTGHCRQGSRTTGFWLIYPVANIPLRMWASRINGRVGKTIPTCADDAMAVKKVAANRAVTRGIDCASLPIVPMPGRRLSLVGVAFGKEGEFRTVLSRQAKDERDGIADLHKPPVQFRVLPEGLNFLRDRKLSYRRHGQTPDPVARRVRSASSPRW